MLKHVKNISSGQISSQSIPNEFANSGPSVHRTAERVTFTPQVSRISSGTAQRIPRPVLEKSVSLRSDEFDHLRIRDVRHFAFGMLFIFSFAGINGFANNIAKRSTQTDKFFAPAFIVWHRFLVRIITFPVYLCFERMDNFMFHGGTPQRSLKEVCLDSMVIYGARDVNFGKVCGDLTILAAIQIISQYGNWAPIYYTISTGTLAAFGSTSFLFVFLLSAIFLDIKVIKTKILGTITVIFGLAILALTEIIVNPKWYNSTAIIWGTLSTALYQVVFKLRIGGITHLGRIYLSITVLAAMSSLLMWPLVLLLKYSQMEMWDYPTLPLEMLFKTSLINCLVIFLTNFAVARINPLFTSIGFLMVVPATYVFDYLWNSRVLLVADLVGAAQIVLGALFLIFGDVLTPDRLWRTWWNVRGNFKLFKRGSFTLQHNIIKRLRQLP